MKFPDRTVPCIKCGKMEHFAEGVRTGLCVACRIRREQPLPIEKVRRMLEDMLRRECSMPWEL